MGWLSKWWGGGAGGAVADGPSECYKGCTIIAAPRPRGGQFQTAGRILPAPPSEAAAHAFIRADLHPDRDQANAHALQKGRQIIDERGPSLFTD